ncbi:hypothetical protein FJZ31_38585 [Candidatus Poribacteria bacterium]|nr:hypothetical protein [Candidatus Poribacteria bacterium]
MARGQRIRISDFGFRNYDELGFPKYLRNVLLMLLVLLSACRSVEYTGDSYKDGISMQSGGKFILECVDGVIVIETWDKAEVSIRTQRKILARTKEQASAFAKSLVIVKQEDNNLHISTMPEEKAQEIKRVEVNYEINLPHGTEIELRNAGSKIERPSIKGRWVYHSVNGRFSIKNE